MFSNRWFFANLLVFLSGIALAAEPESLRVYDRNKPIDDPLLLRSLDLPADFRPSFANKSEWKERADSLREQLLVANGLWPMPERTPLNPVIHGKIDRDEYTIEKVFFASMPGHYVSGNLYRPKGKSGRLPAVISPYGHWAGGRFTWKSDKDAQKEIAWGAEKWIEGAHSALQARCAMLARMGCVVFHYDMVGYADSQKIEHRKGFTDVESVLRLQSQMGLQTWNSMRALDFVTGLPDVDPDRVAVTGASGGGTQTLMICAMDDRPAVSFPAVMTSMAMQGGCVCENAPLLRVGTNNAEIAALCAPKPLGMSAANDWTVDLETKGLPEIKAIYRLFKVPDNVMAKHLPFPHNYNQVSRELMYNWLNPHMKLGLSSPIVEKPFVPVVPEELSVYDKEHPLPNDALDAAGLRKQMTTASDKQMLALADDADEYRKIARVALRSMVVDEPPTRDDIEVTHPSGPRKSADDLYETGVVQRKIGGGPVPYAVVFPKEWDGRVVVWIHPTGKASLLATTGGFDDEVRAILNEKAAVLAGDLFWTGESRNPNGPESSPKNPLSSSKSNPPYAAFNLGYNRSAIANRVRDVLTLVALARNWQGVKSVRLLGIGAAGPWALLARALADEQIDRAAIDLNGFDFDQVTEDNDDNLLPGAKKYGGIYGFVPLCTHGETFIAAARQTGKHDLAAKTPGVTLDEQPRVILELSTWLLE